MKLQTSNKTSSFGKKPYIKRGYYPAKILGIKPYADKEGNLIEGKYGHQLIFDFAVYAKDENDTPTIPMMFKEDDKAEVQVVISKFVYYEYRDKNDSEKYTTALTPNSAITLTLKALGWEFSEEPVEINDFVGRWAELNIKDFQAKSKDGESYTASTIESVDPYKGEAFEENVVKAQEKEMPKEENMARAPIAEDNPEKLRAKIEDLKQLHKDGHLTTEGLKQSVEQLESKLESLTN